MCWAGHVARMGGGCAQDFSGETCGDTKSKDLGVDGSIIRV